MLKRSASAIFASIILLASANAADEGTAVGVKPDALSRTGQAEQILVVGSDVSIGDLIVTGPTGNVQLLFDDQTKLVVGPRSTLEIETYLLNGNGSAEKFAVNALAGTFRFISGTSPKPAYSIDTPTASIAIRGTKFDLTVADGLSLTMLYEGALTQCEGTTCVELNSRCDIAVTGRTVSGLYDWPHRERPEYVGYFPLPNIQSAFRPEFRVMGAQACLAPRDTGSNASISPSGGSSTPQTVTTTPAPPCNPRLFNC
ncbi:FecR family protein [Devosia lucknowensis]|uniref:FecR family protein n=1 Tax=Devosia lucknowensis TaxID=1096929 RepID=A0A1Y6EXF1_9HYPH|nr:FecR domain-containing protein [Devosia lucknowensis]SMQ65202.1 FecR family protein [Devosia lucknowensis]